VAGSPHAEKYGSFEFMEQTPVGPMPFLFIVMSVDDSGAAQIVVAVQNDTGPFWRFVNGIANGKRLTFQTNYGRPDRMVDWNDANSGSVASLAGDNMRANSGPRTVRNVRFTRLDG